MYCTPKIPLPLLVSIHVLIVLVRICYNVEQGVVSSGISGKRSRPPPPCTHVHQRQMMWKGELLGDIFYVKQFLDARPKILNEFNRQIDPELKFYHWTGGYERYRDFKMPSFISHVGRVY